MAGGNNPFFQRLIRVGDRAGSASYPWISSSYVDLANTYLLEGLVQDAGGSALTTASKEKLTLYFDKASSTVRFPISYQLLSTPNVIVHRLESGLPVTIKLSDNEQGVRMMFQSTSEELIERLRVWFDLRISGEWETFYYTDPFAREFEVRWLGTWDANRKQGALWDISIDLAVQVSDIYTLLSKAKS